jgi:hypothetical protein
MERQIPSLRYGLTKFCVMGCRIILRYGVSDCFLNSFELLNHTCGRIVLTPLPGMVPDEVVGC